MANTIDDIKNQVDIIDIVQEYVDLSKKGRNYWGVCPFHDDSNPSMSVSPEKQMYNCFSCGKVGGVFKFVQDIEKISFKEALKKVAGKVGIEVHVNAETVKYNDVENKIIAALNDAMDYYQLSIDTEEGTSALAYAEERGLDAIVREKFHIGYAPKDRVVNFLKTKKSHDESTLINASLMNQSSRDFFQDRLIFGITNDHGDIVAMSGRTLNNEAAKYINSAESVVFKKSKILYNWHNAKTFSKKENEIILVEGFMDVIALYKAGFENVVAIMGTALTKENVSKLEGLTVTLMLDSDGAGISATIKSIKLMLKNKMKVNVVTNELGKDPDEILKSEGKDALIKILNKKISALDYIYEIHNKKYAAKSSTDIQDFVESFRKYLKNATDMEKAIFANKIEKELGISKEITLKGIVPIKKKEWVPREKWIPKEEWVPGQKPKTPMKHYDELEVKFNKPSYTLIRSLLKSPMLTSYYETIRHGVDFIDKVLYGLSSNIVSAHKGDKKMSLSELKYIEDNVKIDGEIVETKEDFDNLIDTINLNAKRHKKKQNNVKLKDKDGSNG